MVKVRVVKVRVVKMRVVRVVRVRVDGEGRCVKVSHTRIVKW